MPGQSGRRARTGAVVITTLVWGVAIATIVLLGGAGRSHAAVQAPDKLDATIFSWDGTDFTRTKTTLVTEDGASAANTKLDHGAAYKALKQKHSFVGEVTVFGKTYDAQYAPVLGSDGKLTGALFVAVPK